MVMDKQALIERLAQVANQMVAQMRMTGVQDWSEIDLTMPQLRALVFLAQEPRRMGDLAASLGTSVSATTSLVERLEGKELAERRHDPLDRRVVVCHLAPQGRAVLDRFWQLRRRHLEAVADLLTPAELTEVIEAMELLVAVLARHTGDQHALADADSLGVRA
jgi:DNA-binding MarR family transcriptional regulator